MRRAGRFVRGVFVAAALVALAGCGRGDSLERRVSAKTPAALASWRAGIATGSGAEHRRRVEEAMVEIRMAVAADRERSRIRGQAITTGAEAIDRALCERVDGMRVFDLLQLGGEMRVRRLRAELAGLERAMAMNAQLVTRQGDLESRHHLDGLRDRQQLRVDKNREELAAAEKELVPFLQASGRRLFQPDPVMQAVDEAPQLLRK